MDIKEILLIIFMVVIVVLPIDPYKSNYWIMAILTIIELIIFIIYKWCKRGLGIFKARYTLWSVLFFGFYCLSFAFFAKVAILIWYMPMTSELLQNFNVLWTVWWNPIELKDKIQIGTLILTAIVALIALSSYRTTSKSLKEMRYTRIMEVDTDIFPKISKPEVKTQLSSDKSLLLEIKCNETLYDMIITAHDFKGKLLSCVNNLEYKLGDMVDFITIPKEMDIIDTINIERNKSCTLFLRLNVEMAKVRFIRLDYDSIYHSNFVEIYEIPNIIPYLWIDKEVKAELVYKKYEWDTKPWCSHKYEQIISPYAWDDITIIDYEGPINKYYQIGKSWCSSWNRKKLEVKTESSLYTQTNYKNILQIKSMTSNEAFEWYYKGSAFFSEGKYSKAIECYDKAIKIDPNFYFALYDKGTALVEQGNYSKAIECYDKAIKIDPNFSDAWNSKGNAFYKQGEYSKAIECYGKAIKINPKFVHAWNSKGNAFYKQGEYSKAIECYNKAIKIDPIFKLAWIGKGNVLFDQDKHLEAIKCYDKAIKIDPNYASAWSGKGNALLKQGKHLEAIECYYKAIKIDPKCAIAWDGKGNVLAGQGNYSKAIECYDKAIKIDPNYKHAWNNKGFALYKLVKYEKAITCYDKAIKIDPKYVLAWINKGYALQALGRDTEAQECFDKARKLDPSLGNTN